MTSDEKPLLCTSAWPNQILPVPEVLVAPVKLREGLLYYVRIQYFNEEIASVFPETPRQVPPELYLRELVELDLESEEAILAFVTEFGPLGDIRAPASDLSIEFDPSIHPDFDEKILEPLESDMETSDLLDVQKIESVRVHAWCLRDAVRLWQVQTGQLSIEELGQIWELGALNMAPPKDVDGAVVLLAQILNAGLRPFHARLEYFRLGEPTTYHGPYWPNLYSALCLQFFNHVLEEAVYLRCANETCGRLFVHQRDRAKQGQYRSTGVKYCSNYCARAQGQRELRRRKAKIAKRNPRQAL